MSDKNNVWQWANVIISGVLIVGIIANNAAIIHDDDSKIPMVCSKVVQVEDFNMNMHRTSGLFPNLESKTMFPENTFHDYDLTKSVDLSLSMTTLPNIVESSIHLIDFVHGISITSVIVAVLVHLYDIIPMESSSYTMPAMFNGYSLTVRCVIVNVLLSTAMQVFQFERDWPLYIMYATCSAWIAASCCMFGKGDSHDNACRKYFTLFSILLYPLIKGFRLQMECASIGSYVGMYILLILMVASCYICAGKKNMEDGKQIFDNSYYDYMFNFCEISTYIGTIIWTSALYYNTENFQQYYSMPCH